MNELIYLDNNATTALDERVLAAMLSALRHTGNASSAHSAGRFARDAIEIAREHVAGLIGANSQEIIFTSGATEANNLAIKGVVNTAPTVRSQIVGCTTEHAAVLEPLKSLRRQGYEVTLVPVHLDGLIDLDQLAAVVSSQTLLVTVMAANNETGVIAPMKEITEIAHACDAIVHTDATQLMAWGGLDISETPVDMLSLSGHKFHGPQGVGALYVRRELQQEIRPVLDGGGQERGLRSGTLNTPGIVGLGAAAEIAHAEGPGAIDVVRDRRDCLHEALREELGPGQLQVNGHRERRVPGTLSISLPGLEADAILAASPTVAMSTGSACSTGVPGPSHVLRAMGVPSDRAEGSIRLSLSRQTTEHDIQAAALALIAGIREVQTRMELVGTR